MNMIVRISIVMASAASLLSLTMVRRLGGRLEQLRTEQRQRAEETIAFRNEVRARLLMNDLIEDNAPALRMIVGDREN